MLKLKSIKKDYVTASETVNALRGVSISFRSHEFVSILGQWIGILEQALACKAGLPSASAASRDLSTARTSLDLMGAIRSLKKAQEYAQSNVSPAAVCGWLSWALR